MTAASSDAGAGGWWCKPSSRAVQARIVALGALALAICGASGCAEPETVELVAIRGCGLDQEFSGLRVRVLGDFPASAGTEILLGPGERGRIPELPEDATGVAAEGLFGTTVTAIGRSYGIDPTLARGRVAGVEPDASTLTVFFAAPDSVCELGAQPSARSEAASAVGPAGDVVMVGGRAADGSPLAELVHVDLLSGQARTLSATLPSPRVGASVHPLGDRRFMIFGGAVGGGVGGEVASEALVLDVRGGGRLEDAGELEIAGASVRVARHAAAPGPDARVLIAGGCAEVDEQLACVPASATASSAWIDLGDSSQSVALPELEVPRFGAHAVVAVDGVAFVAGGFASDGQALASVERLAPGGAWTSVHELPDDRSVAGLTVLDGGLLLLSDRLGAIHWWSEAGSGTLDPTARAPALDPSTGERPLLTLPGERVLVDNWLFAPGSAAVDPAIERVALAIEPRSDASLLALADGTALIVGGRLVAPAEPLADPPLWRLRPRLDGPDEWIPDLAGPQTDAFVTNAPGRATVIVGGLQIEGQGAADVLAPVRAHVRGFRSGALRLEFEFEADPDTTAQLVLEQGAETLVSVALVADGVVVRRRDPSGALATLDCALAGIEPDLPVVLELDDHARRMRLTSAELIAECELEWPRETGVSVGFGASGAGAARFFGLRLARR